MLSIRDSNKFFRLVEILCISLIGLYLLWPLWDELPFASSFSIACFILFAVMALEGLKRVRVPVQTGVIIGYAAFLLWMLIMLVVFEEFYPVHSRSQFFFLNLDSYAMFFVMLLISCVPAMLFTDMHRIKLNKFAKLLLFVVLITTAYYTSKAIGFDADAIRSRQSLEELGYEEILYGAPNYSIIYSFMLLLPFFLHKCATTKSWNRIFYIVCLAMMSYMIIVSQLATALLLSVVGVLIYIFFKAKSVAKVIVAVVVLFLAFLLIDNNGYDMLMALSGKVDGAWSVKLVDMAKSLVGEQDSGTVSGRTELYKASFESFLHSPLVGKYMQNDGSIGGHATAIDVLGLAGIVGFIPFILSIICNAFRMKQGSDYDNMRPVIIATVLQFMILVFTKNVITALPIFFTFFVLVPLFVKSEEKEIIEK